MDVKKELVAYFDLLYSVVVGSNLWISVHTILSMFNRKIKLKLHQFNMVKLNIMAWAVHFIEYQGFYRTYLLLSSELIFDVYKELTIFLNCKKEEKKNGKKKPKQTANCLVLAGLCGYLGEEGI